MSAEIELSGKVISKKVDVGSKSERDQIYLETNDQTYELRRKPNPGDNDDQRGNPFGDEVLNSMVGKFVQAKGSIINEGKNLFLASTVDPKE